MKTKLFITSTIILLSLNACSLFGTTYTKPNIDLPKKWDNDNSGKIALTDNKLPYLTWWHTYHDPELNSLIDQGIRNNNNIYLAMANLDYAKGQLKQVKLSWVPSLPFLFGFSQMPNLGNAGTFYGAWPSFAMNIFSQIHAQKKAKYTVELRSHQVDGVILTVIGQISASYFTYIAQVEELRLVSNYEADINELLGIARDAYSVGISSQINVEQLKTELAQIKSRKETIKNNIIVSQNALHYLLNQNPGTINLTTDFTKLNSDKLNVGSIPINVVNNRPDIAEAIANLEAANQGIGLASADLLPSIRLDVFAGGFSMNGTVAPPNNASLLNEAYASVPLLNMQAYGAIDAARGAYKAAYYSYINVVRNALQKVDNGYASYHSTSTQLKYNIDAFNSATNEYNLTNSLYNEGINSYADALTNRLKVDNIAIMVNQVKLQQFMAVVMLYQELAGGYKYGSKIVESTAIDNKIRNDE